MENGPEIQSAPRKKRGRPPGTRKASALSAQKQIGRLKVQEGHPQVKVLGSNIAALTLSSGRDEYVEEQLIEGSDEEKETPFSSLLRTIMQRDRSEITRTAQELEVSENTIYRWMNGISEPRAAHLKRLPEVLPEHRTGLISAINQTFGAGLEEPASNLGEISKDIYRQVLEMIRAYDDDEALFWQVSQVVFEHALHHLDAEQRGLAITYAKLMPGHLDGIHSLREVVMRGNTPWPYAIESKAYLGSTTLAGAAAMLQRMQVWNEVDSSNRLQVEVDDYEHSACAIPLMRGGYIAGVIIVSSTQPGFFNEPLACQAVNEYTLLMGIALRDLNFVPFAQLHLRPMPDLSWQREQITRTYVNRILTYARNHQTSRSEAELQVQREMELEFEDMARIEMEQRRTR